MQRDCLMKIDENCAALTEKHKVEVGNYMQQYTVIKSLITKYKDV